MIYFAVFITVVEIIMTICFSSRNRVIIKFIYDFPIQ